MANEPASHDFNKDLYCGGSNGLFAGLMVFNADFVSVPWMATKVEGNKDGSVWTFTIRKDSRWSDNSPVSARDFEWSWKRQLDPATAAPYASFLYDIKNGEKFNKKQISDAKEVGVRAKDDWTLEVILDGPRGYFPVLAAYLAALPAHRGAVEKHGDKWTEAANIVTNGPFTLEAWEHNKQVVLKKNAHYYGAKDVHLTRVVIPIIPVASGALPYENNELDMTALQSGDLKRLQSDPRMSKDVFRYPYPGTWYLLPQTTKPPFDNLKVRKAVAHAIDRENVIKVSQGFAIPAWSMIPPGFPGAIDDAGVKAIQKYDKKLALEQLKGTPFEGGKNWPKITLSMRDEGLGSKPLAEAVQAVLLDSLNMKTDLEVLEPRVFRDRLWKQDLQFIWIRWFMDYPDPHNEYFDTFYGKKTTGRRQAWVNDAFDRELEAGRDTRDPKKRFEHYKKAEEIMQRDVGYVPVAWVVRYAAKKPWVAGIEKNKAGESVVDGNIYVSMFQHVYITEKG
jgi:ABC-type oligopeptide transport system substrate-binding subunit